MKLWEKNFEINKEIERFTVGRDRDMDLYLAKYDVLGSMAHITMLESIGLLTKEETKKRRGVCDATLWHWDKKGYLKPVKVGSKVKYRESDVKKILGVQNKSFGNYGKD